MTTVTKRCAIPALLLLVLAGACGRAIVTPHVVTPSGGAQTGRQVNWDNPIGGVPVANEATAKSQLAFSPYSPSNLGSPSSLLVSASSRPIRDRILALIYDTTTYGRVVVQEILADKTPKQFDADAENAIAGISADPNARGTAQVVSIRNGTEAFLTTDEKGVGFIFWVEPSGLEFVIHGPSITKDSVVAIANGL